MILAPTSDCSPDFAEKAITGYHQQIRHLMKTQPQRTAAEIMQAVKYVAEAYGARQVIGEEVQTEAVLLIRERFAYISVSEIKEAYRLWASGELETLKKGEAEMYGGQFNAAQVGKILAAYCEKRKRVVGAYLRQVEEEKRACQKNEIAERQRSAFEAAFPAEIEKMKANAKDWRDCPHWLYQEAKRRGLFSFTSTEEAHEIYRDALELARLEAQTAYADAVEAGGNMWKLRDLQLEMEDQKGQGARAKTIAWQITLFRKVVNAK